MYMIPILGSKIPLKEGGPKPLNLVQLREQEEEYRKQKLNETTQVQEDQYNKVNRKWEQMYVPKKTKYGYNESILKESSGIAENMKQSLFSETIYRIFYEALLIDEDVKSKNQDQLRLLVNESLQNNGDFDKFFNTLKTKSEFLEELCYICESIATKKSSELMMKEMMEEEDQPVFSADETEEVQNVVLANINTDELVDIIKDKVVSVVAKEKQEDEARENMMNELVDIINKEDDDNSDTDEDDEDDIEEPSAEVQIEESLRQVTPVSEYSLFKSLMINAQKEILNKMDDLKESQYLIEQDNGEIKIDMNFVMAEAISNYTLLETLHTLKILELSVQEVRDMSLNLTYL